MNLRKYFEQALITSPAPKFILNKIMKLIYKQKMAIHKPRLNLNPNNTQGGVIGNRRKAHSEFVDPRTRVRYRITIERL